MEPYWKTISAFLALMGLGMTVSAVSTAVARLWHAKRSRIDVEQMSHAEDSVALRAQRLTDALSDAAAVIDEISDEITARQALASKLRADIKRYQGLEALQKEQLDAVTQLLRDELRAEGRRSFWAQAGVNFLFFALGVVATVLLS